jgi:phytoene synthase
MSGDAASSPPPRPAAAAPAAAALSPAGALARAHDPDRFLCALFAPAGTRREALFALTAYNHELARAREASSRNPMVALMRLQWWRDAIADAAAGKPPRRHEVAAPLHAAIAAGALDPADLTAMADAREAEAEEGGIPTTDAFRSYLRGTAGGYAVAAGRLLGAPPAALVPLQEAGAAYGLAGVLRSVPAVARQGRCLLPADALAARGLDPYAVVADPLAPPVRALVAAMAAEARSGLAPLPARLRAAGLRRAAVAAALPLVLARRDLARLARGGGRGGAEAVPAARGLADRLAVTVAGLLGRV